MEGSIRRVDAQPISTPPVPAVRRREESTRDFQEELEGEGAEEEEARSTPPEEQPELGHRTDEESGGQLDLTA